MNAAVWQCKALNPDIDFCITAKSEQDLLEQMKAYCLECHFSEMMCDEGCEAAVRALSTIEECLEWLGVYMAGLTQSQSVVFNTTAPAPRLEKMDYAALEARVLASGAVLVGPNSQSARVIYGTNTGRVSKAIPPWHELPKLKGYRK